MSTRPDTCLYCSSNKFSFVLKPTKIKKSKDKYYYYDNKLTCVSTRPDTGMYCSSNKFSFVLPLLYNNKFYPVQENPQICVTNLRKKFTPSINGEQIWKWHIQSSDNKECPMYFAYTVCPRSLDQFIQYLSIKNWSRLLGHIV